MTTPDHTPYLLPTDLVTAEDARNFLAKWRDSHNDWLEFGDAIDMLDERLDRERRQACRRGALYHWRRVCTLVRWTRDVHGAQWAWDDCGESVARSLSRALAFRAAAKQR